MSPRLALALLAALFLGLSASPALAQREPFSDEEQATILQRWPDAQRLITGVRLVIAKEGTGDCIRKGDLISVYYKGTLMKDGTVFNECAAPAEPFKFRVGRGLVIDGWEQGLLHLREGSKATLVIPYELAYGTRGNPPAVPRQASLVFEVEVLSIERGSTPPPAPVDPKKKKK